MAGVLERLGWPQKTVVQDLKVMELEAAMEILAEVFGFKLSEVAEMIENRFQAGEEKHSKEDGLWPQELWVEGRSRTDQGLCSIRPEQGCLRAASVLHLPVPSGLCACFIISCIFCRIL
jgi:hypothetical protein